MIVPEQRKVARSSTTVQGRFIYLAVLAIIPLAFVITFLGLREYKYQIENVLSARDASVKERQLELEGLAAVKRSEVIMLASALTSDFESGQPLPPQDAQAVPVQDGGNFQLNRRSANSRGDRQGVVLGLVDSIAARLTGRAEMAAVSRLFPVQAATHATNSRLGWTYFASNAKDLIAIYPLNAPEQVLGYRVASQAGAFAQLFESEAFRIYAAAAGNPREPFWTPVHLDFLQDSRVLTVAVPVEANGLRYGLFGAQVPVRELARILLNLDTQETAVTLVNQNGDVLATSSLSLSSDSIDFLSKDFVQQIQPGFSGIIKGQHVAVTAVQGSPWRLVAMTPTSIVSERAFAAAMPYGLALVCIALTFALVLLLLQHQLISPATRLVNFIAADARGTRLPEPKVPQAWQPLSERVFSAARNREAHLHQLRAMIDGIPLRAVYIDHNYIYRDANREFLDFVGLELDELAGKSVAEVLGAGVHAEYLRLTPSIMQGDVARFEGWIEYYGRGSRFLQVSILPFKALDEEKPGFLTFTRDLTELKHAETESARNMEAYTASEALHRSVVLSALDGIVVMDDNGITLEFNPAAQAMFGYSAAEAIGRKVGELIVPPELRIAHANGMERYLKDGVAHVIGRRVEIDGMRRDGTLIPVELTITDMKSGSRRLFISHMRDLTEQRLKSRELDEQREKLHQAEKMTAMGSLLAGVAHELNNPLAVVVAQSTLLEELADSPAVKKRAERIHAAADRCGRIVRTFLAMARQQAPSRDTINISQVIEFALAVMTYSLQTSGVEVETRFPAEELHVQADSDQLSQVVSNLILNAQQAMAAMDSPRRLLIEAGRSNATTIFVRIADNGPGVPQELRERIFEAYFTTKPAGVGTGIGLAVCRNIVRAHGGSLAVEDTADAGATFLLELPAAATSHMPREEKAATGNFGGHSILVVDDEPDVGGTLVEILENMGAKAKLALTRSEAMDLLAANNFDLVMTDLRMPDGGGVALHKQLAASGHPLAGQMVFVTGDTVSGPSFIANAVGDNAPLVLEKPFEKEDIAAIILKALVRAGKAGPT